MLGVTLQVLLFLPEMIVSYLFVWDSNIVGVLKYILLIILKYLFLLRTTEEDSATQKKVNQMLETVDKVKWKTAGHVEEEEEQKVCIGRSWVLTLRSLPSECNLPTVTSFSNPASSCRDEAAAGETSGAGGRGVRTEATTGN